MISKRSGIDCRRLDISDMASHVEPGLREAATERRTGRVPVCLASMNFHPVYAGPAIRFRRYLPGFEANGIDVEILTGTPDLALAQASNLEEHGRRSRLATSSSIARLDGVPIHRVRLPDKGAERRLFLFGRALAKHCAKPTTLARVVQLLTCGPSMLPALIKLRTLGIPLVYTHTLLPEARRRPWFKRAAWRRYVTAPMQLVDAVVVSSGVMCDGLKELGVTTEIRVIPNGVDTGRFHPPEATSDRLSIRKQLGIPPHARIALFLGPIVPRKGIDLLMEAWEELGRRWPDVHLVLAGPRLNLTQPKNADFHKHISRLLEASGAGDRVHFTGIVEEPETYMRAADLFVFPSRREGMPNVVPEAMATGLPVVMTPFQGLPPEFGEDGQHHLLAEFSADSLTRNIERLLEDGGLRRTMGAAAREWAQTQLDVASSIQQYARLYGELAARTHRRELAP